MTKIAVIQFIYDNFLNEVSCRTTTAVAKQLLMENGPVQKEIGGKVFTRWLRFRNLGLGVWEVFGVVDGKPQNMILKK